MKTLTNSIESNILRTGDTHEKISKLGHRVYRFGFTAGCLRVKRVKQRSGQTW
jgi:hypothetical protein